MSEPSDFKSVLTVIALGLLLGLWGCTPPQAPAPPSAGTHSAAGDSAAPAIQQGIQPAADPLDQLIAKLQTSLAQLQENEQNILDTVKLYRVELAKKTADLRSQLARTGQTLDAVRLAPASDSVVAEPRRLDRRCSELRVYLGKIDAARSQVRVLIGQHEDLLVDLPTRKKVNDLIDPQLLQKATNLVSHGDQQNELSPDRILDNPENALLMEQAGKETAAALTSTVLPSRPEKTLEDLPPLPELKFQVTGDAEQFLLDDLNEHLTRGRTTAATHLTENRPEAAIEALQAALDQVQKAIGAFPMSPPLKWHSDCTKQLAETRKKLSVKLAAPYLVAIDAALKEARQSKNWNTVLDLLEALVRLTPDAPELPAKVATLETVLKYRQAVDDLDAAIAWERLLEIKKELKLPHHDGVGAGTKLGDTQTITLPGGVTLKLIWIPATETPFTMGSPIGEPGRNSDEDQVAVTITQGYWIAETELTQAQWMAIQGANSKPWSGKDYVKEGPNFPASYISHGMNADGTIEADSATAYCEKLTEIELKAGRLPTGWKYALPTEAQWEYAGRAGTTGAYSFEGGAEKLSEYAWFDKNAWNLEDHKYAHEVGTRQPNEWGLKDVHGNLWEWCQDGYAEKLLGGSDPVNTSAVDRRVLRGGSWYYNARVTRSASRYRFTPVDRDDDTGFRIVRTQ